MANILEGYLNGKDLKIGIVVARFNEFLQVNYYLEPLIHFVVMKQMKMILMLLGYQVHLKFLWWLKS